MLEPRCESLYRLQSEPSDEAACRCRLPPALMKEYDLNIGDIVLLQQDCSAAVCSCWPGSWSDSCIQYSCLVSQNHGTDMKQHYGPVQLRLTKLSVTRLQYVGIRVVLSNYLYVNSALKNQKPGSCLLLKNVRNLLQGLPLTAEAVVDLRDHRLGKLYGISYVSVRKFPSDITCGKISKDTEVTVESIQSKEWFEATSSYKSESLGGLDSVKDKLKEIILFPVEHQDRLAASGVKWPRGVLLRGPPGCGKTSVVKQVARELQAYLHIINGAEVVAAHPGKSEENLRNIFVKLRVLSSEGPCVLFLDDVDALCPHRGRGARGPGQRLAAQLASLLDQLQQCCQLVVVAATNKPHILDPSIRRPGRIDKEIFLGVPSQSDRRIILCVLKERMSLLISDEDVEWLSMATPGFVGADLLSLLQQAALKALPNAEMHEALVVSRSCLQYSLHIVVPSSQRGGDVRVDHPPVSWQQIGGLHNVKQQIKQAVEWPLKHPEAFTRLGLSAPQGVLLYGPPGCAKTLLVRAAATACHVNFLAVSGAQLYSPFVGDSERKLSQVFQQARAGAPSILFMDELDAIVGKRGQGSKQGGAHERVLTTLLNEMDGIGLRVDQVISNQKEREGETGLHESVDSPSRGVLFVAATNRPDLIDAALLRPGRIDRIIYVPPPDLEARKEILEVHTSNMPLKDTSLSELAAATEGFTGADLENLCREAALEALSVDGVDVETVHQQHFIATLSKLQPSLTAQQIQQYAEYNLTRQDTKQQTVKLEDNR